MRAPPGWTGGADIYALGCVLYEMLAGQPPFTGPTAQSIMARHAVDAVPSLQTVRQTVGPGLEVVVLRSLAKVPADRFATARAFADALATTELSGSDQASTVLTSRSRTRRLMPLAVVGGVAVAVALALGAHARSGRPVEMDLSLVAIAPFRVDAADSSLGFLHEGMVDLLVAKLGAEAGARPVDPRVTLSAWRGIVGPGDRRAAPDAGLQLARRLGAGRVIDGSVVGSPGHLTLSAALFRSSGGQPVARASVEGPLDSLSILLDGLAGRLLALGAGVESSRLSTVSASLPAIHAFLEGRAAFRKGRTDVAANRFHEATVLDSTFALAAFEQIHASKWGGGDEDGERAVRLAREGRNRLSAGDRALLDLWTGPAVTGPDYLRRWQVVVDAYPDRPESWYWLGDAYFHGGRSMGLEDPLGLAQRAFTRGWVLDSTSATDSVSPERSPIFAEPLLHMVEIAQVKGDTAAVFRLAKLGLSADSASWYLRWHRALALGDSALQAFWADSERLGPRDVGSIGGSSRGAGSGRRTGFGVRLALRIESGHPRGDVIHPCDRAAEWRASARGAARSARRHLHDQPRRPFARGTVVGRRHERDRDGGPAARHARGGSPPPGAAEWGTTLGALYRRHVACGTR